MAVLRPVVALLMAALAPGSWADECMEGACLQLNQQEGDDPSMLQAHRAWPVQNELERGAHASVGDHTPGAAPAAVGTRLKVAFAVFITDVGIPEWEDALRVLAHGALKAMNTSRHEAHLLALSPERLTSDAERKLLSYGFEEVVRKPIPVPPDEIQGGTVHQEMSKVMGSDTRNQFALAEEQIKYWGVALTEYDRVLVIDADTMILDPMDDLMAAKEDLIGVYDWGLDKGQKSAMPPVQGGFLLFRPNLTDFEAIKALQREGDWDGGGWKRSGIGYAYGGAGPDGLLQYYYNQGALELLSAEKKESYPEGLHKPAIGGSRFLAVERPIYDVVITKRLLGEMEGVDMVRAAEAAKSVHFTGDCVKPWICAEARGAFCQALTRKWWELRAEVESRAGLRPSQRGCALGRYSPIKLKVA